MYSMSLLQYCRSHINEPIKKNRAAKRSRVALRTPAAAPADDAAARPTDTNMISNRPIINIQ